MLTQHTITTLKQLKLDGMAKAFEEQLEQPAMKSLAFEERFGMVVDRELNHRDNKRVARLKRYAKFKFSTAYVEDIDYHAGRSLDQPQIASLISCDWIRHAQNVILIGLTGVGKSWLACALGNQACRQGFSVCYVRVSRLFEELRIAHADGSFMRRLSQLAKTDLLILDDFAMAAMGVQERLDLLEVIDDRVSTRATLVTSQLPTETWHEYLNDPTVADAILDRVLHQAHKLKITGKSMRDRKRGQVTGNKHDS
jgi:DNA replication protein DnaC